LAEVDLLKRISIRGIVGYLITRRLLVLIGGAGGFNRVSARLHLCVAESSSQRFGLSCAIRRWSSQAGFACLIGHVIKTTGRVGARQMIQNLFGQLARFLLRSHFLQHRVFQQLLLNQIRQLECGHLQHLDALTQLRR